MTDHVDLSEVEQRVVERANVYIRERTPTVVATLEGLGVNVDEALRTEVARALGHAFLAGQHYSMVEVAAQLVEQGVDVQVRTPDQE